MGGLLTLCFGEEPLPWGVRIHNGGRVIEIPAVSASGNRIGAATVLPATDSAPAGTFVCRVGGKWAGKRVGPGTDPNRLDAECILFVNLESGAFKRFAGLQPAPDFIVQSPDGKWFALGSSVGWGFHPRARAALLGQGSEAKLGGSDLRSSEAQARMSEMLVGTVLFSIWESETLRPVWQMRYPDIDHKNHVPGFVRPWEENAAIPIPWWAIDAEPFVYNYPVMAFSPDEQFFVALSEESGLVVLNMVNGQQFTVFPLDGDQRPKTFVFSSESTIAVFRSDGTISELRLHDGTIVKEREFKPDRYPITSINGEGMHPLFCPDSSGRWIATISGSNLQVVRNDESMPPIGPVPVVVGELPVGVNRFELSGSKRWAGFSMVTARETIEDYRYHDIGFTDRFERMDLLEGRIVERILNVTAEDAMRFEDGVPTINLGSEGYLSSFAACLSSSGENIIYAVPYRSTAQ